MRGFGRPSESFVLGVGNSDAEGSHAGMIAPRRWGVSAKRQGWFQPPDLLSGDESRNPITPPMPPTLYVFLTSLRGFCIRIAGWRLVPPDAERMPFLLRGLSDDLRTPCQRRSQERESDP